MCRNDSDPSNFPASLGPCHMRRNNAFRWPGASGIATGSRMAKGMGRMSQISIVEGLVAAAGALRAALDRLEFQRPVSHVYNPLDYAWPAHEAYLRRFGNSPKRVVFLGMNPGPFGMVQTGVPFGEVAAVRDWMRIRASVAQPCRLHPKRPVMGFACNRSEVSGRRLWGLFAERSGDADHFFRAHFVANFCPLAFFDAAGRNLTPDKLPAAQRAALFTACDRHLHRLVELLQPEWLIGIGDFAAQRARLAFPEAPPRVSRILHPSPASPVANRGWARRALAQLRTAGVWRD